MTSDTSRFRKFMTVADNAANVVWWTLIVVGGLLFLGLHL